MLRGIVAALLLMTGPVAGQTWTEPARGTVLRAALMDAVRPHAEWQLGAPLEFIVHELRVAGDLGFAMLTAQRPGGGAIDLYSTPGYARGDLDPGFSDGASIQVLYKRSGETWVAVHHALGATDVWWSWDAYCAEYRPVIADACIY